VYALLVFAIGLLFGLGLVISGMTNPAIVLAFLDFAGDWNPALAFVMGGALLVATPAYAWARRRGHALGGARLELPEARAVTPGLVIGAALFGVGWGLSGFCPGPAIVNLATGNVTVLIFAAAMAAGIWLQRLVPRRPAAAGGTGGAAGSDKGELACG
jgi:hypothetical protein